MTDPLMLEKSVTSIAAAVGLYVIEPMIANLSFAPEWIHSLGLPVTMLLLCIAGLIGLFKALSAERLARIADRDAYIAQLREDALKATESREKLIAATTEQTLEFKSLKTTLSRIK
jgi:hypothetical protein